MGFFSFMFADTNNTEALKIGKPAYVVLPNGGLLHTARYDGYGNFDSHNIFELVVDWNKEFLSEKNLVKPCEEDYDEAIYFNAAMRHYEYSCSRLNDFLSGKKEDEMIELYDRDWKMDIGIDIAGDDEQNEALIYPIKICKEVPADAALLPASKDNPMQGCS